MREVLRRTILVDSVRCIEDNQIDFAINSEMIEIQRKINVLFVRRQIIWHQATQFVRNVFRVITEIKQLPARPFPRPPRFRWNNMNLACIVQLTNGKPIVICNQNLDRNSKLWSDELIQKNSLARKTAKWHKFHVFTPNNWDQKTKRIVLL